MCGLARLPDQQPVIEDVEQPDRAVPRDVERHRSGRPIGAAAAVSVLLEADLAGSGLRDDFAGGTQVAELMCAQGHRHPLDRRGRCRSQRDCGQEDGQARDRQSCCPCIHDDSFRL